MTMLDTYCKVYEQKNIIINYYYYVLDDAAS